jgi:hypothetical protein
LFALFSSAVREALQSGLANSSRSAHTALHAFGNFVLFKLGAACAAAHAQA